MRLIFTAVILIIYYIFIVAQENSELNKIWVANDLKCFDLRFQNEAFFDYGLVQHGKLELIFTDTVFYLVGGKMTGYIERGKIKETISFQIIKLTEDTLIVHPLNINAKILLEADYKNHSLKHKYGDTVVIHESDKYLFLSKDKMYDKDFEFDKIYFSTQGFTQGLHMNIEINRKGEILFHGISNSGEYKGKYSGKLSRKKLNELENILKYSAIDLMPEKLVILLNSHSPNYAMIISYNGTIKKIKRGTSFPYFNKPLLEFLLNIYENTNLKRNENIEFTLPNTGS